MKIDSYIKEQFGIKHVDIRTYSPLTLLHISVMAYLILSSAQLWWEKAIQRQICFISTQVI